jgi:hypothetical protein
MMERGRVQQHAKRGNLPKLVITPMSPMLGPTERGQYEHWALIASVLEHKDNVDILCSKLSIIDPVFTCVLVSLFLLVRFDTKTRPCSKTQLL